jgi:hypothetical protein
MKANTRIIIFLLLVSLGASGSFCFGQANDARGPARDSNAAGNPSRDRWTRGMNGREQAVRLNETPQRADPRIQGSPAAATSPKAGVATIELIGDNKINMHVENRSLNDALRLMTEKKLFDIKGPIPSGETISVSFSSLTLDQALKKLMRGYNYVLMEQPASRKPLLVLMGKIQRSAPSVTQTASQRTAPPAGPPANQAPAPGTYYVPPSTLPPESRTATAASPPEASPPGRPSTRRPGVTPPDQRGGQPQVVEQKPPEGQENKDSGQGPEGASKEGQPPQIQPDQPQPERSSGVSSRDLLISLGLRVVSTTSEHQ